MRWVMRWLTPKSAWDFAGKLVMFCLLVFLWHVLLTYAVFQDRSTSLTTLARQSIPSALPFILLFMLATLYQVKEIRRLTHRARYDPLSGVFNRQTFLSRFRRALPRAKTGLILLIDVDHFKRVNDNYGHASGDLCIEAIGHRLNWHLRVEDLAGRVGGEEFAIFLPDVTRGHGRTVAQRLAQPVTFTDASGEKHLSVTLSVGAVWADHAKSFEQNLLDADEALYAAKENGRAQIRYSDGSVQMITNSGAFTKPDSRAIRRQRTDGRVISRWG